MERKMPARGAMVIIFQFVAVVSTVIFDRGVGNFDNGTKQCHQGIGLVYIIGRDVHCAQIVIKKEERLQTRRMKSDSMGPL